MSRHLLALALATAALPAHADLTWTHALRNRLEMVDDAAFAKAALAPTVRYRPGVEFTGESGFGVLADLELVAALDDRFDSGANGQTRYPAVTDPSGLEVNQAAAFWRGKQARVTVGRQRLLFENQRFVGNSGWRQNEQTFDALDAQWSSGPWAMRYAYLDRVHRVAGDDARVRLARERNLDGHALLVSHAAAWGKLSTYGYLINDESVPVASSRTYGARWSTAPTARVGVTLEAARQTDNRSGRLAFSHAYRLAELSLATGSVTWRAGWEQLQGNGTHAFQTPLATLHAFNGWADRFTTTPAAGLEDRYLSAAGTWTAAKSSWIIAWHDFVSSERTPGRYGQEWDASLARPIGHGWTALTKIAVYDAKHFSVDTSKLWLQLEWAR